ncbi:MAG: 1-acyl-sn-glycerol-3-phosphate acyltransferase [Symbiobacteriaceae bacterium]|nr:1-acyl-sn-glycerol-3-phosphate acyltransferase [Symbiobacteriaceae bacterium]
MEHIPAQGGGIVCPNHTSNWDPPLVGTHIPRELRFMAKEELYRMAFLRWLLPLLGTVKVNREENDRDAMRQVLQYLQKGDLCVIFPEGSRYRDGELHPFLPGAAYFALKTGVPLIPLALVGDYQRRQSTLQFRIGQPLYPPLQKTPKREDIEAWTEALYQAVRKLQEG